MTLPSTGNSGFAQDNRQMLSGGLFSGIKNVGKAFASLAKFDAPKMTGELESIKALVETENARISEADKYKIDLLKGLLAVWTDDPERGSQILDRVTGNVNESDQFSLENNEVKESIDNNTNALDRNSQQQKKENKQETNRNALLTMLSDSFNSMKKSLGILVKKADDKGESMFSGIGSALGGLFGFGTDMGKGAGKSLGKFTWKMLSGFAATLLAIPGLGWLAAAVGAVAALMWAKEWWDGKQNNQADADNADPSKKAKEAAKAKDSFFGETVGKVSSQMTQNDLTESLLRDEVLKSNGIDPKTATPDQKQAALAEAQTIQRFSDVTADDDPLGGFGDQVSDNQREMLSKVRKKVTNLTLTEERAYIKEKLDKGQHTDADIKRFNEIGEIMMKSEPTSISSNKTTIGAEVNSRSAITEDKPITIPIPYPNDSGSGGNNTTVYNNNGTTFNTPVDVSKPSVKSDNGAFYGRQ